MKRILYVAALLCAFDFAAFGQGSAPLKVREVDGSPSKSGVTQIVVSNGSLTISGTTATIVTGGGGGGTPGGNDTELQYNNAGSFGGITGATTNGTFVTLTTPVLGVASATSVTASAAGLAFSGTNTTDNASVQAILLQGDRATVAGNDEAYATLRMSNAAGTQTEVARITWAIPTATAAAEDGRIDFSVMTGGALAKELQLAGADLSPSSNDGLALGNSGSLEWSDLFLASGSVIGFNGGDVTITHSANLLTIAGGNVIISSPGSAGGSVATIDGSQTLTNKTITASSNVLGGVTMTLGSDADGDIYYRASNVLTRLPKGTALQQLRMNAGATAPEWATISSSGLTVGTTTVTSGTGGRFMYETSGNVLGEVSTLTSDGTIITFAPTVTTGTGATAGLDAQANSLTTGDAFSFASSSVTSGNVMKIAATGTAAASNTKTALNVATSGTNGTSTQTTYGARISNTSTGTSSTNIGLQVSASGGSTNTALDVSAGNVTYSGAGSPRGMTSVLLGGGDLVVYQSAATALTPDNNWRVAMLGLNVTGLRLAGNYSVSWSANTAGGDVFNSPDTYFRRNAAAHLTFGTSDAASPVAQTLSVQNVVGGTTNTAGATATLRGSLGTSQGAPGRIHLTGGAMIAASGTTQQTAVDRIISGATKVLTNNSATTITNVTAAAGASAGGQLGYMIEVDDGAEYQYEVGVVSFGVTNKSGVFSGNTATKFGNHQNATSGTLTVTFAISGANPALLSVNANSSLTPATGFPRITYWLMNGAQQAIAVQ